jgi:hypothetical protein
MGEWQAVRLRELQYASHMQYSDSFTADRLRPGGI